MTPEDIGGLKASAHAPGLEVDQDMIDRHRDALAAQIASRMDAHELVKANRAAGVFFTASAPHAAPGKVDPLESIAATLRLLAAAQTGGKT